MISPLEPPEQCSAACYQAQLHSHLHLVLEDAFVCLGTPWLFPHGIPSLGLSPCRPRHTPSGTLSYVTAVSLRATSLADPLALSLFLTEEAT